MTEPILTFESADDFDRWLATHHASSPAVMVRMGRKGHPPFVAHQAALDAALCWGWIDSVRRSYDATSFLQRFSRRTAKSPWSQVNVAKVEALVAAGRMTPAGQAEIDRAKADGRWQRAYASSKNATVPADFAKALARSAKARAAFETCNAQNRFAFLYRIGSAKKPETRARRIADFTAMLAKGELLHPPRKKPPEPKPPRKKR
jgi:uncharacterized protein YdeI (YjbR/CyaY-like superfamily)